MCGFCGWGGLLFVVAVNVVIIANVIVVVVGKRAGRTLCLALLLHVEVRACAYEAEKDGDTKTEADADGEGGAFASGDFWPFVRRGRRDGSEE